jgi:hypothetical protein
MRTHVSRLAIGLLLAAFPALARAQTPNTAAESELAFMPRTMTVTLLNEGGKYVAIDLKHIPQGGTCRMDEGATIFRIGHGATDGTTRVRYAAPQISSGGCPLLTIFDLPTADYNAARAAFTQKEEEASRKVDQLKKDLGEKWDEVTGKKRG